MIFWLFWELLLCNRNSTRSSFISFGCAISEDGWLLLPLVIFSLMGLNTLFQTTWFTKDMIPLCAGTLGWIGSYFKTSNLGKSKD